MCAWNSPKHFTYTIPFNPDNPWTIVLIWDDEIEVCKYLGVEIKVKVKQSVQFYKAIRWQTQSLKPDLSNPKGCKKLFTLKIIYCTTQKELDLDDLLNFAYIECHSFVCRKETRNYINKETLKFFKRVKNWFHIFQLRLFSFFLSYQTNVSDSWQILGNKESQEFCHRLPTE